MANTRGRSGRPWRRTRLAILARDAGICHLCGHPGATTVDHIIPLSQGGHPDHPNNLRAAHATCNTQRGTKPPTPHDRTSRKW